MDAGSLTSDEIAVSVLEPDLSTFVRFYQGQSVPAPDDLLLWEGDAAVNLW
jgi:hypothetical protein